MVTTLEDPTLTEEPAAAATEPLPELADDPETDEAAWRRWVTFLVIGVALGIPIATVLLGSAFVAFTSAEPGAAYVIAGWASLWMGVFAGGVVGSTIYELKNPSH